MTIRYSPRATRDLESIREYLAKRSPQGAINVLTAIYAAYLLVLSKLPPEQEGIDELERIPRSIVLSPRPRRIAFAIRRTTHKPVPGRLRNLAQANYRVRKS